MIQKVQFTSLTNINKKPDNYKNKIKNNINKHYKV
jgi:hypothetical protein